MLQVVMFQLRCLGSKLEENYCACVDGGFVILVALLDIVQLDLFLPHVLFYVLADCHLGLFGYIDPQLILHIHCFSIFVYSRLDDEGIAQYLPLLLQKKTIESYSIRFGTLILYLLQLSHIISNQSLYQPDHINHVTSWCLVH